MAAMDLFGRRWALRILWELREGPLGARALLARCEGLSSSGIVAGSPDGYGLTRLGAALGDALRPLDDWATVWARTQAQAQGGQDSVEA
jgi:DNA-binding HxlR family transcriptional regulator